MICLEFTYFAKIKKKKKKKFVESTINKDKS